jgi:fibronectin type III domain protein
VPLLAAAIASTLGVRPAAATTLLVGDPNRIQLFNALPSNTNFGMALSNGNGFYFNPTAMTSGPDGYIYVCDAGPSTSRVLRYTATYDYGHWTDNFVQNFEGGLNYPSSLAFGPDGNLYVASANTDQILRYSGMSGTFMDAFVPAGSGGLSHPASLLFGPDGKLYVASANTNQVLRYDGTTGAFIDAFVTAGSGGLSAPKSLAFGPDGHLYVASAGTNQVLRYNGTGGGSMGVFVAAGSGGLVNPVSMAFGPAGNLYVVDPYNSHVLRYNGATGAYLDTLISSYLVHQPSSLVFSPPAPPSSVFATPSTTQLSLNWTLASTDETAILLWRKGGGADWAQIASLPPTTNSYIDTGLVPATSYTYRVRVVNPYGVSIWSLETPVETSSDVPWDPTGLMATAAEAGTISLSWLPPSPPPYSPPVLNYSIWRKGGGADWAPLALVPGDVTSYVDTGLPSSTQYTYRVRALTGVATSVSWSNEASTTTPIVQPAAPSGLTATIASSTEVDLSWTLTGGDETGIAVWRKAGSGSFARIAVLPAPTTHYSDTGLIAGTAYTYEVRAVNDFFASPWSNQVTVTPR